MQINTEIVRGIHPNFTTDSKFPLGFDSRGILRFRNLPGGTYANAAAHGVAFDLSDQKVQPVHCSRKTDSIPSSRCQPVTDPLNQDEDSDSEDFVEPIDYELEMTYQRGVRLHGETKKTTRQIVVHRKLTQQKSRECKHALRRDKKQKQKIHLKGRQIKSEALDTNVKKCLELDAIWIKNQGWTYVSEYILPNQYPDLDTSEDNFFWGFPFDIGTDDEIKTYNSPCTCDKCTNKFLKFDPLTDFDPLSDSDDDDPLSGF